MWEPSQLSMIDLSFNGFTTVPEELEQLPNLSVIYLHGNEISKLKDVRREVNVAFFSLC